MGSPSSEGFAPRAPGSSFSGFCRRLLELNAGDPRSWITSAHVDSTSSQARRFLDRCRSEGFASVPPCCFVAWEQSAGRGRGVREWSSTAGLGLHMTLVLPGLSPAALQQLPLTSAIVVAREVSALLSPRARIKWPNDILSGGRKLAGILVEASSRGTDHAAALVGVGINVRHNDETLPLSTATSLALEGATDPDMALLACRVAQGLEASLKSELSMPEVVEEYRAWSGHQPGDRLRCRMGEKLIEGDFAGFGEDGSLLVERRGQVIKLRSSEIVDA